MIPETVIERFLRSPRDDHTWLKYLSERKIDAALASLSPPFETPEGPPLSFEQKVCVLLGIMYPAFFFMLDMGLGKSRIALELIRYWIKAGVFKTALILAPSDETVYGWEDEINKWTPEIPKLLLANATLEERREAALAFDFGLMVTSYAGLFLMVSGKQYDERRDRTKLKYKNSLVLKLCRNISVLVADESTKCQNLHSLTYLICRQISKNVPIRYLLAGLPFGRDPKPLWPQCFLVDHGASLGPTFGLFQEAFYTKSRKQFTRSKFAFEWTYNRRRSSDLSRMMGHRSIKFDYDESHLPALVHIPHHLILPEEAFSYYQRLLEELRESRNVADAKNVFLLMRQISSGFIGVRDDDTGERVQAEFSQNPKLKLALELMQQVPKGSKAVIYYEFTYSGKRLVYDLRKRGLNVGWLWSGTKNSREILQQFKTEPDFHLVLNHKLGAYGLNLQAANHDLIYETPVPVIDRKQLERRTRRQGQLKTVFRHDFIMRGTVDEKIFDFYAEGRDLYEALYKNRDRIFG